MLIVFGAAERTQVETIRPELSAPTQAAYDRATVFHDGKWLWLRVGDATTLGDVQRLLTVKRRLKRAAPGAAKQGRTNV